MQINEEESALDGIQKALEAEVNTLVSKFWKQIMAHVAATPQPQPQMQQAPSSVDPLSTRRTKAQELINKGVSLPWFQQGLKGFLRKIWHNNSTDNPSWDTYQHREHRTSRISLKEYVSIKSELTKLVNESIGFLNEENNTLLTDFTNELMGRIVHYLQLAYKAGLSIVPSAKTKTPRVKKQPDVAPTETEPTETKPTEPAFNDDEIGRVAPEPNEKPPESIKEPKSKISTKEIDPNNLKASTKDDQEMEVIDDHEPNREKIKEVTPMIKDFIAKGQTEEIERLMKEAGIGIFYKKGGVTINKKTYTSLVHLMRNLCLSHTKLPSGEELKKSSWLDQKSYKSIFRGLPKTNSNSLEDAILEVEGEIEAERWNQKIETNLSNKVSLYKKQLRAIID